MTKCTLSIISNDVINITSLSLQTRIRISKHNMELTLYTIMRLEIFHSILCVCNISISSDVFIGYIENKIS